MNEHDMPDARKLRLEPEDLNGHTIDELSEYLDAGRTPLDPSIEQSPGCQIALDALARLHTLTPELLAADTAAEPEAEEGWVQNLLAGIVLDARAGRRIPLPAPVEAPNADLGMTEGAARGLIRAAENAFPGVLVGKCRIEGDVTVSGEPVRVSIDISVPFGEPIPDLAERLRGEISRRLITHTRLTVSGIDINVHDIQQVPSPAQEDQ